MHGVEVDWHCRFFVPCRPLTTGQGCGLDLASRLRQSWFSLVRTLVGLMTLPSEAVHPSTKLACVDAIGASAPTEYMWQSTEPLSGLTYRSPEDVPHLTNCGLLPTLRSLFSAGHPELGAWLRTCQGCCFMTLACRLKRCLSDGPARAEKECVLLVLRPHDTVHLVQTT